MKGLDLSRAFFEEYGLPMLKEKFPELLPKIAVGRAGAGSECWGFDDEVSEDHDFSPEFCLFLPSEEEVDRRTAFLLERVYDALPKNYQGFTRQKKAANGDTRTGVIRTSDFWNEKVGTEDGHLSTDDWLLLPQHYLSEAVNGEIWLDESGDFSRTREYLNMMPEEVKKKRIAGHLLLAGQTGQYNYLRCLSHQEEAAAQLSLFRFTENIMAVFFLANGSYMPYYKWAFKAMSLLPGTEKVREDLEYLISYPNTEDHRERKRRKIEEISLETGILLEKVFGISKELSEKTEEGHTTYELERAAYVVNDSIKDSAMRNLSILYCVE